MIEIVNDPQTHTLILSTGIFTLDDFKHFWIENPHGSYPRLYGLTKTDLTLLITDVDPFEILKQIKSILFPESNVKVDLVHKFGCYP